MPHDVAVKLANDIESVALPILEDSDVLTEDDLTQIIKSGAATKQEAIAGRAVVSEKISEVSIATAGEKVVAKLMENTGAKSANPASTRPWIVLPTAMRQGKNGDAADLAGRRDRASW